MLAHRILTRPARKPGWSRSARPVYVGPVYAGPPNVVFEPPAGLSTVVVGYPGFKVSVEMDPLGKDTIDTERLRVATEVATGSTRVTDGVLIGVAVFELPRNKLLVPNRIEMIAVAIAKDGVCCDALEVDTTTGGVEVEDAVGIVELSTVGASTEDVVDCPESAPGVTIIAASAVMAVKDRTVTFCIGSGVVDVDVTYVPHVHFPTGVPLNC